MHAEESVSKGKPPFTMYEWLEKAPGRWNLFQPGIMAPAKALGKEIVAKIKLPPTARRLLDIGSGHGMYSVMFCYRYPEPLATIFDASNALVVAKELIASEKMAERISLQSGDYWKNKLGSGYDAALLFNIIHAHSPDKNKELLVRAAAALNPGGLVVILEQLAGKTRGHAAKIVTRFFALNYLATLGGQIYPFNQVSSWLMEAGFSNIRHVDSRIAPGVSLVSATKTGFNR